MPSNGKYAERTYTSGSTITAVSGYIVIPPMPAANVSSSPYPTWGHYVALTYATGDGQQTIGVDARYGPGTTDGVGVGYGVVNGWTINAYAYLSNTDTQALVSGPFQVNSGDTISFSISYSGTQFTASVSYGGQTNTLSPPSGYLPAMVHLQQGVYTWNIGACNVINTASNPFEVQSIAVSNSGGAVSLSAENFGSLATCTGCSSGCCGDCQHTSPGGSDGNDESTDWYLGV
jgi:hypothetical protein